MAREKYLPRFFVSFRVDMETKTRNERLNEFVGSNWERRRSFLDSHFFLALLMNFENHALQEIRPCCEIYILLCLILHNNLGNPKIFPEKPARVKPYRLYVFIMKPSFGLAYDSLIVAAYFRFLTLRQ